MSTRWRYCLVKVSLLLPLLFSLFLIGCETAPSLNIHLSQTEAIQVQETRTVPIDNCRGLYGQPHLYSYPLAVGSVGVENLVPNGGEPFASTAKRIKTMYGNQASGLLLLFVPAGMKSEFTVTATIIKYRGTVSGDLVDVNKVHPDQDAVYFYPFLAGDVVSGQLDISCPWTKHDSPQSQFDNDEEQINEPKLEERCPMIKTLCFALHFALTACSPTVFSPTRQAVA